MGGIRAVPSTPIIHKHSLGRISLLTAAASLPKTRPYRGIRSIPAAATYTTATLQNPNSLNSIFDTIVLICTPIVNP